MIFIIITFLLTILGITGIIHALLLLIPAYFFKYDADFSSAIVEWVLILFIYYSIDPSILKIIPWILLSGLIGLLIRGKFFSHDLTDASRAVLGAQQFAVIILLLVSLILKAF